MGQGPKHRHRSPRVYPYGLDACVPTIANWCLSALPRYLQPEQVERIVAACDPHTKFGVRDRAIVLLLARLGLRAGDLVLLRWGDIDLEGRLD